MFATCVPSLKGWSKCPRAHHPPAATGIGAELSGKTQLVESGKIFKRSAFRKLVFSFWLSSNENCRCFFWKSNSAFSLSGETTATKKTAPNLRKTYGKKKVPCLYLVLPRKPNHLLEKPAASLRAPEGFFVHIKQETKLSDYFQGWDLMQKV